MVELSIRDLKAGPLAHMPSSSFPANGAWLQCAVLAHNLIRWTTTLGDIGTDRTDQTPPTPASHPAEPNRWIQAE